MASDYTRDFADRRQIRPPEPGGGQGRAAPVRDPFAGLDIRPTAPVPARDVVDGAGAGLPQRTPIVQPLGLETAVQRFARAAADILRIRKDGYTELPHQRVAYDKARVALEAARPEASRDLSAAFAREPDLIGEAVKGRTSAAIRAMVLEAEMRGSPEKRADRFVEDLQKLAKAHRTFRHAGDVAGARGIAQQMSALCKSLERDAQAESLVRKRLPALGIHVRQGDALAHGIQDWIGLSRGRGLGR